MPVHARKVRRSTHLSSPSSVAWRSASWIVCWRLARRRRFDVSNVSSLWLARGFAVGTQGRTARHAAVIGAVCRRPLSPATTTALCTSQRTSRSVILGARRRTMAARRARRWCRVGILGGAWTGGRSRIAALCLAAAFLLEPLVTFIHAQPVMREGELALGRSYSRSRSPGSLAGLADRARAVRSVAPRAIPPYTLLPHGGA